MTTAMLIFGVLTVMAACGVVFSVKTFHSALWLVATLFLIAIHFALLGADFLAALQIMVYAGAIMVLVLFVIMLLGLNEEVDPSRLNFTAYLSAAVTGAFLGVLLFIVRHPGWLGAQFPTAAVSGSSGSPAGVGYLLFTKYLYPFEITSLLLLAAIIGAVILAYEPKRALPPGRGLKAKRQETPETN